MDITEIKETDIWALYDKSVSYCRLIGMYGDTDVNYRMYNGDQWYGLKVQGVEKIQYNFIRPVVKYKTGVILSNLYAINYSSENVESKTFRKVAVKICELLNKRAAKIWEHDYMDIKLRQIVKDAAINDEGIMYVRYSDEMGMPINEVINKNDIYYGNENYPDMQSQPYILIKQRKPISEVRTAAEYLGVPDKELEHIIGDMDNIEEAGESAKYEKDNMCTVVTKLYKEKGTVHFAQATRYVDLKKDTDTGLTYYPVAHFIWEDKKGSARGEGEVRQLIPNQLETNKTAMRRALTVKNTAYPQKVANTDKIANPSAIGQVGGIIKTKGGSTIEDVGKILSYLNPAQMSSDVEKLQQELITTTRELAGAGEIATGDVNPESASGRAILAVQQASQQPLTEHLQYLKAFIEELARIWLDMLTVYNDSISLEEETEDPETGEKSVEVVEVQRTTLEELKASVKVDITPKGAFDRYAQEQSMENLLTAGLFNSQRMPELKLYTKTLDDDSVMPKQKLEEVIENWEIEQQKIAAMNAQAMLMQQRAQQFLMQDPDAQASQMAEIAANNSEQEPE
ncbi:MAG: hypothetical protein KHY62_01425 [Firmicutes bacterium]|nr:hypothetical protein [Bacillota bacterium]